MPHPVVAASNSVFPNLEPARAVLSRIGAELRVAEQPTPDGILKSRLGR